MSDKSILDKEPRQDGQEPESQGEEKRRADQSSLNAAMHDTAVTKDVTDEQGPATDVKPDSEPDGKPVSIDEVPAPKEPQPPQPGACGQFFNGCAAAGPLMLFLVLAALVWGGFWQPGHGVYCPPESSFVTALLHCMDQNFWLAPLGLADGAWTIPQWPVFYWLAWALSLIPGMIESAMLLPTLSTIAAIFILLGVWSLAIASGFGRRSAFAAGLIIICAPFFVPVAHFVGPMPMAAALMLLSLAFFARGWRMHRAWLSLPLGFILAGLAGLCGGPLYFLVPLLASACFLVWQARFRRAHAWDAVFGFSLMLVIVGGWLAWVTLGGPDNTYLARLFSAHMLFEWPPAPLWERGLLIGIAGILPWTLLVFTVSWPRVIARSASSLVASRKHNASALIWISIVLVCLASPFLPLPPDAGLPLIFLNAVLLGRAFVNLSLLGNRSFFLIAGIFVCLLGLVIIAASFETGRHWLFALLPFQLPAFVNQALTALPKLYYLGIVLLVGGLGSFFFARSYQAGGGLIYGAIIAMVATQLAVFMIAPDLAKLQHGKLLNLQTIEATVEAAEKSGQTASARPAEEPTAEQNITAQPAQESVPDQAEAAPPVSADAATPEGSAAETQPEPAPAENQPEIPQTSPAGQPEAPAEGVPENQPDKSAE